MQSYVTQPPCLVGGRRNTHQMLLAGAIALALAGPAAATVAVVGPPESPPPVAAVVPDAAARPFVPPADPANVPSASRTLLPQAEARADSGVTFAAGWRRQQLDLTDTVLDTVAAPGFREIVVIGFGLIFAAMFLRRRRRRRIGWGVLPERSASLHVHADGLSPEVAP